MHRDSLNQLITISHPSSILRYLLQTRKLDEEIARLIQVPQDQNHHPEGNAYLHTEMVLDQSADIADREKLSHTDNVILRLAALCHDMGKFTHTQIHEDGRITAWGHPEAGVVPAMNFLVRSNVPEAIIAHVLPLVNLHMAWVGFYTPDITSKAVNRLLKKLQPSNMQMLAYIVEADMSGRGGKYFNQGLPDRMKQIMHVASVLNVKEYPDHLVSGDDIMAVMQITPSPLLGKIKEALYKAQLEGKFTTREGGLHFLANNIVILKGNN